MDFNACINEKKAQKKRNDIIDDGWALIHYIMTV
jgi:hypothetical protein